MYQGVYCHLTIRLKMVRVVIFDHVARHMMIFSLSSVCPSSFHYRYARFEVGVPRSCRLCMGGLRYVPGSVPVSYTTLTVGKIGPVWSLCVAHAELL